MSISLNNSLSNPFSTVSKCSSLHSDCKHSIETLLNTYTGFKLSNYSFSYIC